MIRALRASARVETGWRLLTPLLVLSLLLSVDAVSPSPAVADNPFGDAADVRQRQLRTEATMLRADKQIKRLQKQRRSHGKLLRKAKRKLERAIERRDRARQRSERADARYERAERVFQRAVWVRPNPKGAQVIRKPALRKKVQRLERSATRLERSVRQHERKVERARTVKQSRWKKVGRSRIEARRAARERAEDRLGASITAMLELAQGRADRRFRLASTRGFRKPVRGTITQRYGCTGYPTNPARGGCRHFHDGVDIAAARGARVRASADGYVAYVGRNPWDRGKRSFVVIIGHAGGYHSVYAHLQPKRVIRAGQRIDRGDVIGRIGMTGRTTGPHVHWEVFRDGSSQDPLRAGG